MTTNTLILRAREAAFATYTDDQTDLDVAVDAAVRLVLTEMREAIRSCALKGEYVPGEPAISAFGRDSESYNEGIHACFDLVDDLLKGLRDV